MLNDADVIRLAGINVHAGADGDTLDLSAYAPPEPPENGNQLPTVNEHGAVLWRGDDSELADALIRHWLGPYAVATAGEVWQWQPERRGWVRITTEQLVAWLSSIAGAPVWGGTNRNDEPILRPLTLPNARIRGAISIAYARIHHDEDEGDWWTVPGLRKAGIVQFRDRAVIVEQVAGGRLRHRVATPEPDLRVRASSVLPAPFDGVPDDLSQLNDRAPAFARACWEWWGHHGEDECNARALAILEFLGASVLGLAPMMARALMLYGPGGTGKSTLIELLTRWCQPRAICSITPQEMGVNRFATAQLDGALLNVVDDLPAEPIKDAGAWKSSITGGRMGVERKGLDGFTIYPRAGHIYAGNRLPVAVRANSGFWRRWLVIEYDRVFAGTSSDRDVLGAIEAELPDIIAHAIRAFLDTGGRGGRGFTEPACHRALMGQWETISDSVAAFRDDCIRPVPEEWSKVRWPLRSEVHRAYRDWCEQVGRKPVSAGEFYSRLEAYGIASSKAQGRRVLPIVLDMSEVD